MSRKNDDRRVADERHFLPRDRVDDFAHRRHRAAELRQIAAEREHALGDALLTVAPEHLLFDVVEAVVDRVGGLEVAVDEHVEDGPEQEALFGFAFPVELELEATHDLVDGNRVAVLDGVADREHPSRAHDQVDLAALEVVVDELAVVHRNVEALPVADELGALRLRVHERVDDDRAELELAQDAVALFFGGLFAVDPHQCGALVDGGLQAVARSTSS